jgi:hypothetical protein
MKAQHVMGVVTPAVEPVRRTDEDRRAILRRRWLNDLPAYLSGSIIGLGAFAAGAVLGRGWGVAATATACAQPYLATLGTPLRPYDRRRFGLDRCESCGHVFQNAAVPTSRSTSP